MPDMLAHRQTCRSAQPAAAQATAGGQSQFAPCHIFPSADGAFFVAVSTDQQIAELSHLAGQSQWLHDPRFATHGARIRHEHELNGLLRRATVEHRTDEWMAALRFAGVPCAALAPSPANVGG